jgi:hypothetical protein
VLNIGHDGDIVYSIAGFLGPNAADNIYMLYDDGGFTDLGIRETWGPQHNMAAGYIHTVGTLLASEFYSTTDRISQVVIKYTNQVEELRELVSDFWTPYDSQLILGRDAAPAAESLPNIKSGGAISLDDWLIGGDGDDWLEGFRGDDILEGDIDDGPFAGGNDFMAGGEGKDIFLSTPEDLDGDTIVDLEVRDFIQLKGVDTADIIDNFTYFDAGSNITLSFNEGLLDFFGTDVNINMEIPKGGLLRLLEDRSEATIEVVSKDYVFDTFNNVAIAQGVGSAEQALGNFLNQNLSGGVSSATYTGADAAGFFVPEFSAGNAIYVKDGIFLTSGGFPGSSNTQSRFSVGYGTEGDDDLTNTVQTAFPGAEATQDASVVEFTLNVSDPNVDGIRFNLVFGSDEYPEFSSSNFTDIAAVYVNGVNYALFDNDPSAPLEIIDYNLTQSNFIDNTSGTYPIEWDGFIQKLAIRAPLIQGNNIIKIGVAGTGDTSYDSGIFIDGFGLLSGGALTEGILNVIEDVIFQSMIENEVLNDSNEPAENYDDIYILDN